MKNILEIRGEDICLDELFINVYLREGELLVSILKYLYDVLRFKTIIIRLL